jgi:hypothetical protein
VLTIFFGKSRLKNQEKFERNYFFRSFFPLSALAIFGISAAKPPPKSQK